MQISRPTCNICFEPMLPEFTSHASRCTHTFCTRCMSNYIETNLRNNLHHIRCPEFDCHHYLNPLLSRPQIACQLFVKWCDLLCDNFVLQVDHTYCPNENCSSLLLNECKDDIKRCKCPNCKKPFCFRCKKPWHAGKRCKKNVSVNDKLFAKLVAKKKWKTCPTCGHCVERVLGCHIIRCRCGENFCYKCGGNRDGCKCGRFRRDIWWLLSACGFFRCEHV